MPSFDRLPSGRWRVRVVTGGRTPSGSARTISRTARTKEEAKAIGRKLEEQYAKAPLTDDPTVRDLFDRWFVYLETKDRSPSTIHNYRRHVANHVLPNIGSRRLSQIGPERLNDLYRELLDTPHVQKGAKANGKTLSPTTVRQIHAILRSCFHQAYRWGMVGSNPVDRAEPPSMHQHAIRPPTMLSISALLEKLTDDDAKCFVRLAAATGARRGEMCALRWTDIDFDAGELTIARSWVKVPGTSREKSTKTRAKRTMSIDPGTMQALADRRTRAKADAERMRTTMRPDGFVLSGAPDSSEPWPPDRMSHAWAAIRKTAGLPSTVRLHDLRHMHATEMLTAGVPLSTVSERLGHAGGGSTTLKVYAHASKPADRAASDLIGGMLG